MALPGESTTVDQASRMSRSSRIWSLFDSVRRARKRRSSKRKKNSKRDGNIVEEKDAENRPTNAEAPTSDTEAPPVTSMMTDGAAARSSPSFAGFALYRPASSRSNSSASTSTTSSSIYSRSRSPGTPSAPLSRVQSTSQHSAATNVTTRPGKIKRLFSCCAGDFFDVSLGHLGQYGAGHVM